MGTESSKHVIPAFVNSEGCCNNLGVVHGHMSRLNEGLECEIVKTDTSTLVNLKSCEFKKEAYRDGIKRKGDKIGIEYMKHG